MTLLPVPREGVGGTHHEGAEMGTLTQRLTTIISIGLFVACTPTGGDDDDSKKDAASQCEPEADRRCSDGHPHFVDSCGEVGERIATCEENQTCESAECVCADPFGGPRGCHEGDVWRYDACGGLVQVVEPCDDDEVCMDAVCVDEGCMDRDELCNGADDDCDGEVDEEEDLCPEGSDCVEGGCVGVGSFCDECQADRECQDGYRCAGYANFTQVGKVCVLAGCDEGVECPEGTACNDNGLCWFQWTEACHEGNTWSFDVCERRIRMSEECDPERPCTDGRCVGDGEFCDECPGDRGCKEGFRCRGYGSFPEIPQVCVPESDCDTNPETECDEGLQCGGTGVCWLTWDTVCDGQTVWNVDTCDRRVQEVQECPERSPCQEGRCVGEGTTCDECESEADCALSHVCRGYQNFPDLPQICVPQSNCAEDPEDSCPDGLRCGASGVCWMYLSPLCKEDGVDVWDYDTCGRLVRVREECGADRHCEPISGDPGSAGDDCADAAMVIAECWADVFDEDTFLANCEAEGTAAEIACITGSASDV